MGSSCGRIPMCLGGIIISGITIGSIILLILLINERKLNKAHTNNITTVPKLLSSVYACYAPAGSIGSACDAYKGIAGHDGTTITYSAKPLVATTLTCYGLGERFLGVKEKHTNYYLIYTGDTPICWGDRGGYPSIKCGGLPLGGSYEWSYTLGRHTACLNRNIMIRSEEQNWTDIELPRIDFENITLGNISGVIGKRYDNESLWQVADVKNRTCMYGAAKYAMNRSECQSNCQTWYPGSTPCQHGSCCSCNVNCDGGSCASFDSYCYCPFDNACV